MHINIQNEKYWNSSDKNLLNILKKTANKGIESENIIELLLVIPQLGLSPKGNLQMSSR